MNLKKHLLLTLFMFSVCFAYSQTRIVKTSPISLAFGNINLRYESKINDKTSWQVGANYIYKFLGTDVSSFGLDGEYRFYLTNKKKDVPEGFYIGPNVGLNFGSYKVLEDSYSYSSLGLGATLGYQWIWDSGITLEVGAGPQYSTTLSNEESTGVDFNGILPRLVFAIGYAF